MLAKYVEVETNVANRQCAYTLLASLARSLKSVNAVHVILSRLPMESKSDVVGSMLDNIVHARIRYTNHVENVIARTGEFNWTAFRVLYLANSCREEIDACIETALGEEAPLGACFAIREDSSPDLIEPLLAALSKASGGPLGLVRK